jgi:predicted alpha/beta-fold hydrolase
MGSDPVHGFLPHPRLRNGHLMTIYAWARPRRFPRLPRALARYFDVAPDTRVLAHCHWHESPRAHATLLCLHGLEGSSSAHYMSGLAEKAFAAGMNVVLLNQRNCGGTESLCPGLYHSGLTDDPRAVIEELRTLDGLPAIVVAGYSLGGNVALRLAGEYGGSAPAEVRGVAAVSPIIEVEACVRALEQRANVLYEWNFVKNLKARMRRKAAAWPGRFPVHRLRDVRTVRLFDDIFTAPHFGFQSAEDYYHRVSAMRVIDRVRLPTLIVAAKDDPFVPWQSFVDPGVAANPHVRVELSDHGGHCAFVARSGDAPGGEYWAERRVVSFALSLTRELEARPAPRSADARRPDRFPALRA